VTRRALLAFALAKSLLLLPAAAVAVDPGYYVVTAYDNAGVAAADFRYWTVRPPGEPTAIWPEAGLGYGVSSRWYTEVFASWIGASDMATRLSSWNWQNEYLLTQGESPIDLAIHAMLVRDADRGTWEIEYGPVLQTDVGRTQLNANVFFDRGLSSANSDRPARMKYQWQVKYRWMRLLNVGAQGFGELGPWNDWWPRAQQSHRAGPAAFGTWDVPGGHAVLYQAAWLWGSVYGSRASMFSMRVQYTF